MRRAEYSRGEQDDDPHPRPQASAAACSFNCYLDEKPKQRKPFRTLYVANLSNYISVDRLSETLKIYGEITDVKLVRKNRNPRDVTSQQYRFAFVTFSSYGEAERCYSQRRPELDGRKLYIAPADDWHQPEEREPLPERVEPASDESQPPDDVSNILDVLNDDCFMMIFSYVPIIDLIRTERTSARWRRLVLVKLNRIKCFNSLDWDRSDGPLTTNVFRSLLLKFGASLQKIEIKNDNCLNERTSQLIGKYCPNLEEIDMAGFSFSGTQLFKWCKNLKSVTFTHCRLTDAHLSFLNSNIEEINIKNCDKIKGYFLDERLPLNTLSILGCDSFTPEPLYSAFKRVRPTFRRFTIELGCGDKVMCELLRNMPNLEFFSWTYPSSSVRGALISDLPCLECLKEIHLCNNFKITDNVLELIAKNCKMLEVVNISLRNKYGVWRDVVNEGSISRMGFENLLKLPNLKKLVLESVEIAGESIMPIKISSIKTNLEHINCSQTAICDSDILKLISCSPSLKTVQAVDCPNLTCDIVQNLITNVSLEQTERGSPITLYISNKHLKEKKNELVQMSCKYLTVFVQEVFVPYDFDELEFDDDDDFDNLDDDDDDLDEYEYREYDSDDGLVLWDDMVDQLQFVLPAFQYLYGPDYILDLDF